MSLKYCQINYHIRLVIQLAKTTPLHKIGRANVRPALTVGIVNVAADEENEQQADEQRVSSRQNHFI